MTATAEPGKAAQAEVRRRMDQDPPAQIIDRIRRCCSRIFEPAH